MARTPEEISKLIHDTIAAYKNDFEQDLLPEDINFAVEELLSERRRQFVKSRLGHLQGKDLILFHRALNFKAPRGKSK